LSAGSVCTKWRTQNGHSKSLYSRIVIGASGVAAEGEALGGEAHGHTFVDAGGDIGRGRFGGGGRGVSAGFLSGFASGCGRRCCIFGDGWRGERRQAERRARREHCQRNQEHTQHEQWAALGLELKICHGKGSCKLWIGWLTVIFGACASVNSVS
jgi:hypothetical protein